MSSRRDILSLLSQYLHNPEQMKEAIKAFCRDSNKLSATLFDFICQKVVEKKDPFLAAVFSKNIFDDPELIRLWRRCWDKQEKMNEDMQYANMILKLRIIFIYLKNQDDPAGGLASFLYENNAEVGQIIAPAVRMIPLPFAKKQNDQIDNTISAKRQRDVIKVLSPLDAWNTAISTDQKKALDDLKKARIEEEKWNKRKQGKWWEKLWYYLYHPILLNFGYIAIQQYANSLLVAQEKLLNMELAERKIMPEMAVPSTVSAANIFIRLKEKERKQSDQIRPLGPTAAEAKIEKKKRGSRTKKVIDLAEKEINAERLNLMQRFK